MILLSTAYFQLAGTVNWRWLAIGWAVVPLCAAVLFCRVPINSFGEPETNLPMRRLFSLKMFWALLALMMASGAAEQAMAQWASLFAELGLGVSKAMGDLLGPCLFAAAMGTTRLLYGKFGARFHLTRLIALSAVFSAAGFLIISLVPNAIVSLLGCGLCGVSVAILWPGVLSLSARDCPQGGTAMFALLALAGDVGCFVGPDLVGAASDALGGGSAGVKLGMLAALVFPAMEGVETRAQVEFLKDIGCGYAQGYYFAKPMQVSDYEALVEGVSQAPAVWESENLEEISRIIWCASPEAELLFNTICEPAAVCELLNGNLRALKVNPIFYEEFGDSNWIDAIALPGAKSGLSPEDAGRILKTLSGAGETKSEACCAFRMDNGGKKQKIELDARYWGLNENSMIFFLQFRKAGRA